jgi:starch synthase
MRVLFGHPGGAPFSYNAALAHHEVGRLEAICVPWMPTPTQLRWLKRTPGLSKSVARLERRCFPALANARRVEGKLGEWNRMFRRLIFGQRISTEALAYEANDWLMETMSRECRRTTVTAVHSYEDCSLKQFQMAKSLGKPCIYDLPIGYYPAWEETQHRLSKEFADWLPEGGLPSRRYVRPEQKKREMELADLVLGPCSFVAHTVREFHEKRFARAAYGVDSNFWHPKNGLNSDRRLRFIYAGQASIRKGIPLLLKAWEKVALKNAELFLVGTWQMANSARRRLPINVTHIPPCSPTELRSHYQSADIFVFPSYFEGFGLVSLEAMACGLPLLASERTAAPDFLTPESGSIVPAGNLDAWVEALRDIAVSRERLPPMKAAARRVAVENTWERYRQAVSAAIDQLPS